MEDVSQPHAECLQLLQLGLTEIHQSYSDETLSQLIHYIELIEKHNEDLNLTPFQLIDIHAIKVLHLEDKRHVMEIALAV